MRVQLVLAVVLVEGEHHLGVGGVVATAAGAGSGAGAGGFAVGCDEVFGVFGRAGRGGLVRVLVLRE